MITNSLPPNSDEQTSFGMVGSLTGRLQRINLSTSNGLQPLFEALTNSFQSIQETGRPDGIVEIRLERDTSESLLEDGPQPITRITIQDNGAGFTKENFDSFRTPDSLHKANIGGKGIGRLLWLKAFEQVEVESVYNETGTRRRVFSFLVDDANPIQKHACEMLPESASPRTKITLVNFLPPYRDKVHPKPETLADRIIVRFLLHFLDERCPRVRLDDGKESFDLNARFKDERVKELAKVSLDVKGQQLEALLMQLKPGGRRKHTLHLCAASCEVETTDIDKHLPHVPSYIPDSENNPTRLAIYVTGEVLTRSVNEQRTAFNLPKEDDALEPTLEEVIQASCNCVADKFRDLFGKEKEKVEARIRAFITQKRQIYRPMLPTIQDHLARLEKCTSDNDLDLTLNTIVREIEIEADAEFGKYREPAQQIGTEALRSMLTKITEASRVRLSQYVARRRAVLFVLKSLLQNREDGGAHLEADIHDLVFPMGVTSDEVPIDRWNLWLVDERLAFHEYLASDKPLKSQKPLASDSADEPDLLVLNRPGAFAPGFRPSYDSIVLVEFKRPMRQDVGTDELPHTQALRYINKIQNGNLSDVRGRPINALKPTRFFCYLVCDFTHQLKAELRDLGFHASPDELSFFQTVANLEENRFVHYEYIALDRLYEDAEKRNLALFDKLGIIADPDIASAPSPMTET